MPRNTKLVIIGLALFATVIVGVNLGRNTSPAVENTKITTSPAPTNTPTITLLTFSDPICNVSFQYPDSFTVTEIETGGAVFTNSGSKESLSLLCQKSFPKPTGKDMTVVQIPVGSGSATLYRHVQTSGGTFADKLLITHPKNKLQIYITGPTQILDAVINSLSFL